MKNKEVFKKTDYIKKIWKIWDEIESKANLPLNIEVFGWMVPDGKYHTCGCDTKDLEINKVNCKHKKDIVCKCNKTYHDWIFELDTTGAQDELKEMLFDIDNFVFEDVEFY